jgi:hypothetical protein
MEHTWSRKSRKGECKRRRELQQWSKEEQAAEQEELQDQAERRILDQVLEENMNVAVNVLLDEVDLQSKQTRLATKVQWPSLKVNTANFNELWFTVLEDSSPLTASYRAADVAKNGPVFEYLPGLCKFEQLEDRPVALRDKEVELELNIFMDDIDYLRLKMDSKR